MTDISYLQNEIPEISTTHVIAYKNEVKELLLEIRPNTESSSICAVDLNDNFVRTYSKKPLTTTIQTGILDNILLEPSRAIIKAGLASNYCQSLGLRFISRHGLYFFNETPVNDFMGRQFQILARLNTQWKEIKKYLKKHNLKSVQIAQRNFFDDVKTIRKKLKISDGGDSTLIFTKDQDGNAVCLHVRQLLSE